jgi:hypothetical protein
MQWSSAATIVYQNYFQPLHQACHELAVVSLTRLCGLRFTLIDNCRWAIEDWVLLTLLAIEGMLLSGLVVRLVKRRCLS